MQPPKPLKSAHEDLRGSLYEWMRAKKRFEDKYSWPQGHLSPHDILRRIDQSADRIYSSVMVVGGLSEGYTDEDHSVFIRLGNSRARRAHIMHSAVVMGQSVRRGTDIMLDHCEHFRVFVSWQEVCGGVESFARSASDELKYLASEYRGERYIRLFHDTISLDDTAKVALRCRKRGIKRYLKGPFSKYARDDAKGMGLSIRDLED
jgi:hypothetical protein